MMNPRTCLIKHDPPRSHGDCVRACIATMIDRDDVPHTFDGRIAEQAWSDLRLWLAGQGKTLMIVPSEDHAEFMSTNNPGIPYMLLCSTVRGDHCVICCDGNVIHDPAWYKESVTGPHSLGFYIICIVGNTL